jgi:hypothetical protein
MSAQRGARLPRFSNEPRIPATNFPEWFAFVFQADGSGIVEAV